MSDSDADPPEPVNPFAGIPMFADMAKKLQNQGPINWDLAQQFAYASATGGASEANIDPISRVAIAPTQPAHRARSSRCTGAAGR